LPEQANAAEPAAPARTPRLALAAEVSDNERRLIGQWLRSGGLERCAPAEPGDSTPTDLDGSTPPELLVAADAGFPARLQRHADAGKDALIIPVRVVWLPRERDGDRRTRWSDLVLLANPRKPGRRRQQRIASREPDRCRIVAGEAALLSDLRTRHQAETGSSPDPAADPAALARYVRRAAVVTLERAERRLIGDRYKVPRLVAEQITDGAAFREQLSALAQRLDLPEAEVRARAEAELSELVAVQSRTAIDLWSGMMRPLHAGTWTVDADQAGLDKLRELNRQHALIFLPSHRSYADSLVLAGVLARHDFPGNHIVGGNNLNIWPVGPLARRAGVVFIRRSFGRDEIYKTVVQEYFGYLLSKRFNLEWYFEGGRSRTGKLRSPRYGLLHYVAAALQSGRADDVYLVPVSITYERLAEVSQMAAEQAGAAKKKEGLTWLARYAQSQRHSAGAAQVRFGAALLMRERLAGVDASEQEQRAALQKIAFEVAVGINRAAPVTANALVTLTLLGVRDQALTLTQVRQVLEPILGYIDVRQIPATGIAVLRGAAGVSAVLAELHRAGVVSTYAGGEEPVYAIEPGQHMVAAFYRNNAIHWFVNRAIVELAMLHAAETGTAEKSAAETEPSAPATSARRTGDPLAEGRAAARRLRDQLKFEFFFPGRDTFEAELTDEMRLIAPDWDQHIKTAGQVRELLTQSGFLMAHRVLRSFLDAQLVVAERLAARDASAPVETDGLLDECEAVGQQMLLQGRLHGPESLSRELFISALKLAENHDIVQPGGADLAARRQVSASYVRDLVARVRTAESLDASLRAEVTGAAP
jgi:glycerol-3-phosphate O-acyltransferase